jgi:hypothetical protein
MLALALAFAGCAPKQGLLDALEHNYHGYEELAPKLSPEGAGQAFPYTPGTILSASAVVGEREQRTWVASTDLHCGPKVALGALRYWQRRAYRYRASRHAEISAQDWLEKRMGASFASLAGVSDVIVEVRNVRSYEPSHRTLAQLNARAAQGCWLDGGQVRRVRGVIVGDVRVHIHFEHGVDLMARGQVSDNVAFALGFGFARISDDEIVGHNVAFGVKWQ